MRRLLYGLGYVAGMYVFGIIIFTLFRLTLFLVYSASYDGAETFNATQVAHAFWLGFRFDTVVSCYILVLPLLAVMVSSFFRSGQRAVYRAVEVWAMVLYSVAFLLSAANIPYFMQFYKPINSSIWNWLGEPSFVLGMIVGERSFLVYLLMLVVVLTLSAVCVHLWTKAMMARAASIASPNIMGGGKSAYISMICTCLAVGFICFAGLRGRLAVKAPIKIGTAYFCNNAFLNQLGLNPVFVFLKTTMEMGRDSRDAVAVADPAEALAYASSCFGRTVQDKSWATFVDSAEVVRRKNVVLILLESCNVQLLEWEDRTPNLNALARKSVFFPGTFSAGIHTMNGIMASMFGFPAELSVHPFRNLRRYTGLPSELRRNGYRTMYFTTHDDQFDNIGGFVLNSDIELLFAERDYPMSEVRSNLGVPDDYMFRFAVDKISSLTEGDGKPFFAMLLTASNHQPYIIPEYFSPKDGTVKEQIVEYSDWALGQFFAEAVRQPWYANTIFVLVGDHGSPEAQNLYDVSLPYHQVPLIFYEPGLEHQARVVTSPAAQTDIWPTVMGRLGLAYRDESFGFDLYKHRREMVCFSSDDSYSCVDSVHYYVNRLDGRVSIYNYAAESPLDSIDFYRDKAACMDEFARNVIQAAYELTMGKELF